VTDTGRVVDVVADRGDLAVPEDLLEMVTVQFHSLDPDERAVLEAASVAGVSFAPWMVGRALWEHLREAVRALDQRAPAPHAEMVNGSRSGRE